MPKKKLTPKPKKEKTPLKSQFRQHTTTAIIAAFSFIMALSWRDLIAKIIQDNLTVQSIEKIPYLAELITAILVTIIAVLGIVIISKWAQETPKSP